ncbi:MULTISPECIES: gamma carbonic anhydrase family protein [Pseudidiomarina]|uniref:Anhydrase n=1 Tax=Pseudidiomarina atlantica TaxID=1517416 RepID=A0A094IKS5_9GAMM|nr:gamma carbonic anhydrase family protein [Pseudidiomarina atlantica]KFZ27777.1 anhydrase [Pseudidiomarina atlantica]
MPADIRSYRGVSPTLGDHVYVDASAVVIGDVSLGEDSSVWPLVAARGDVNFIRIGARTNIQDNSVLHVSRKSERNPDGHPLIIGDDVTVGHHVMLHGCTIGSRVLIGMSAIVMDGVTIEDDVIVGAGSLVPPGKTLRSGYLYVGSPAQEQRPLTDAERAFLPATAANYVKLKNEYSDNS